MKIPFNQMWGNYPHKKIWSRKRLFNELGWQSLYSNSNYNDTCAIRTSVALQKSGVNISSSAGMKALAGGLKGKGIEISQIQLSKQLESLWGTPEIFSDKATAESQLVNRNGLISFFRIPGYQGGSGGHIDLLKDEKPELRHKEVPFLFFFTKMQAYHHDEPYRCASACYFNVPEIWFWELL